MTRLTREEIRDSGSDKELLEKLFAELVASVPSLLHEDLDEFVVAMGVPLLALERWRRRFSST